MLSFASSLSPDSEAFAIFVNDRFHFRDKKNVLSKEAIKKIDSYLSILKDKKSEEEISSLDISTKQKCFIIKVKKKYETYYPEEKGGIFYSYLKNFKNIKKIDIFIEIVFGIHFSQSLEPPRPPKPSQKSPQNLAKALQKSCKTS